LGFNESSAAASSCSIDWINGVTARLSDADECCDKLIFGDLIIDEEDTSDRDLEGFLLSPAARFELSCNLCWSNIKS
jgi:hypothetical protein